MDGSWTLDDAVAAERQEPRETAPARAPVEFAFSWSRGATEVAVATGLMLISAILLAVASGATWGTVSAQGATLQVRLEDVRLTSGAQGFGLDWSHQLFDEFQGIGQVRLAGTLFTVGLISTFVSAGILGVSSIVRGMNVTTLASVLCAVAWALALVATILFPGGAETVWDDAAAAAFDQDVPENIQWTTGRVLGWLGLGFAGLGLLGAFASLRHADVS